ncbi:iron-containing redox enzyme family protein [Gloeocapsa sp. BRSZ]
MISRKNGYRSRARIKKQVLARKYNQSEQQLKALINLEELDERIQAQPWMVSEFELVIEDAIAAAYQSTASCGLAQHFLHRLLYRINRLKLFWYDNLRHYTNERSIYLHLCREKIETAWQQWELASIDVLTLQTLDVQTSLLAQINGDRLLWDTQQEHDQQHEMTHAEYHKLLAIAAFETLQARNKFFRTLANAVNEVESKLTQLLLEDYSRNYLSTQHSTLLAQMLSELQLNSIPEAYFKIVPYEVLACANHNFLLTDCKRLFLRCIGGMIYSEIAKSTTYKHYLVAAQRLGLSATKSYWERCIIEDECYKHRILEEVALPLVEKYPASAWELLLGYEQQKQIHQRASAATLNSCRESSNNVIFSAR